MFCSTCGKALVEGTNYCAACGNAISTVAQELPRETAAPAASGTAPYDYANDPNLRYGRMLSDKMRYRYKCEACDQVTDWLDAEISTQFVYILEKNVELINLPLEQLAPILSTAAVKTDPTVLAFRKRMETGKLNGKFFEWFDSRFKGGKTCPNCGKSQSWFPAEIFTLRIGCLAGILFAVGIVAYLIGIFGTAVTPSPTREMVGNVIMAITFIAAAVITCVTLIRQAIYRRKYKSKLPYRGFLEIEWPEEFRSLRDDEDVLRNQG